MMEKEFHNQESDMGFDNLVYNENGTKCVLSQPSPNMLQY